MITHQRLDYTQQALAALLQSDYQAFEVVIWDNASTDGSRQWLVERYATDPRISIVLSNRNWGVAHPMNVVWGAAKTPLIAKVDNDTIIPRDLLHSLAELHFNNPKLGVISGCHFRPEDVEPEIELTHPGNAETAPSVRLLRQNHVGGCAVMMRRSLFEKTGKIPERSPPQFGPYLEAGWTDYQHRLHDRGFANGYPLPLLYVDHMEDTRSPRHNSSPEHEQYKLAMRGQSLSEYTHRFYIIGGKCMVSGGSEVALNEPLGSKLQRRADVTLFIPLAGRMALWPQLCHFLQRQTLAKSRVRLVLLDTSQDHHFSEKVKLWATDCGYCEVRVISECVGSPGLADMPRREVTPAVRKSMAQIYDKMRELVETEFVWILEDDILPPDDVGDRLLANFNESVQSVAAPYKSRFGNRYVVWDQSGLNFTKAGQGTTKVGGNGFGCVFLRGQTIQEVSFDPYQDCDRQFYREMAKTNCQSLVDWTCECHHGLLSTEHCSTILNRYCDSAQEPSIA